MAIIDGVQVEEVSREEGIRILDAAAWRYLKISGDQFLAEWQAGKYADRADTPEVIRVAMLIPFAQ